MKNYYAVHMKNNKTGEIRMEKVSAMDINSAFSKKLFYGSEWDWTGTEPWKNIEENVEMVSHGFYKWKDEYVKTHKWLFL